MRALRRGVSAMEALVFFVIAMVLVLTAWKMFNSGIRVGKTAVEGLALQSGIRNALENLTRDVNGAMMIAEPHAETPVPTGSLGTPATGTTAASPSTPAQNFQITLYQHQSGDPAKPVEAQGNADSPYPFGRTQQENSYGLPVLQVVYQYNAQERTLSRGVRSGLLQFKSTAEKPGVVKTYEFDPNGETNRPTIRRPSVTLAREVERFEATALSYDYAKPLEGLPLREGVKFPTVVATAELPEDPLTESEKKEDRTVGIALRIKAAYAAEGRSTTAKDSSMEILTKIFSYPKMYDHNYRAYFSTVDSDLRY